MDPAAPVKKPLRLTIFNQQFTLLVSGDTADLEEAAHTVDELMTSLSRSRNLDTTKAAVFACLHLADRIRTMERELEEWKQRVDAKSRRISSLLDQVIE
jgi:cell division protein ZapA